MTTGVQTAVGDTAIGRVTTVLRDTKNGLIVVQVPAAGSAKASYFVLDDDGKRIAGPIDPGVTTSKPSVDPSTGNIVATASLPAAEFGGPARTSRATSWSSAVPMPPTGTSCT
ncbi:hypothetical protein P9139_06240 [Curtobacterium flaccumfaciens]|nr:hypothetical protein P9139_06240 [Curtobacterium flaccumfaciens]